MYFGFKNISVGYGKRMVIQNLDLEFPKGKVVTIIGQNGCRKIQFAENDFQGGDS